MIIHIREQYQVIFSIIVIFKLYTAIKPRENSNFDRILTNKIVNVNNQQKKYLKLGKKGPKYLKTVITLFSH